MNATRRKPENHETNATRQARLRERRKEQGYRRITIWLSPDQVDSLETLGGESWLGRTVKELLTGAVSERQRIVKKPAALFVVPSTVSDTVPDFFGAVKKRHFDPIQEAKQLQAQGLSWNEIARRWNSEGRRTDKGAAYRGANIAREVRKWK